MESNYCDGPDVEVLVTRGNQKETVLAFTICNVLDRCSLYHEGDKVLLNGHGCGSITTVDEGDIITLIEDL